MIKPRLKIASTEFVNSILPKNEDSQPADRVSLGFDAVLAQLQELVSTLSDRVERGEAVIERIEQALSDLGIDLDAAEEEAGEEDTGEDSTPKGGDEVETSSPAPSSEEPQPEEGETEPENDTFD